MVKISIGTAGWDYKDWIGTFYPKKLEKSQHLEYFSKYFDVVEINSTFYNLPTSSMVENWYNRVPQNFRFIVKVWQRISHNLNDPNLYSFILDFFSRIKPLANKISGLLIQFPPWFKCSENHLSQLIILLKEIPAEYRYFIELRDDSWFNPEILKRFIDGDRIVLGTTYKPHLEPFYWQNQNFYYIRLIGDRELTVFNRIQRDQKEALKNLYKNVQSLMNKPSIYEIFIIVNNHFQGAAPESVVNLKQKYGLKFQNFRTQKSLIEYLK